MPHPLFCLLKKKIIVRHYLFDFKGDIKMKKVKGKKGFYSVKTENIGNNTLKYFKFFDRKKVDYWSRGEIKASIDSEKETV